MKKTTTLAVLLLSFIFVGQAQAGWIWTPESGRWINPKSAAKDTPSAQLEYANSYFESQEYKRAAKEYIRLVRAYPESELAPEAQFKAGQTYELLDRPDKAFEAYKKLAEVYPFSKRFKDAIEAEYKMGEVLLDGKKVTWLKIFKFSGLEKAAEIFQHVVKQAPYGDYADDAQLKLGETFLKQERFEEAHRAFQRVLDDYPNSELVETAKFKVAFCARQLSREGSYDQSATEEAITWYKGFLDEHPDSDKAAEAQTNLNQLYSNQAQGLLDVAEFYEKQGQYKAAAMYYVDVTRQYPGTNQATLAVSKLKAFEEAGKIDPYESL